MWSMLSNAAERPNMINAVPFFKCRMPSLCLHKRITMQSLWSVVVCMRIDTIQTYDPYGSTVVEQSPFLGSLIIV